MFLGLFSQLDLDLLMVLDVSWSRASRHLLLVGATFRLLVVSFGNWLILLLAGAAILPVFIFVICIVVAVSLGTQLLVVFSFPLQFVLERGEDYRLLFAVFLMVEAESVVDIIEAPNIHLLVVFSDGAGVVRAGHDVLKIDVEAGVVSWERLYQLDLGLVLCVLLVLLLVAVTLGKQVPSPMVQVALLGQRIALLVGAGNVTDVRCFQVMHWSRLVEILFRPLVPAVLEIAPEVYSTGVGKAKGEVVAAYDLFEALLAGLDDLGSELVLLVADAELPSLVLAPSESLAEVLLAAIAEIWVTSIF